MKREAATAIGLTDSVLQGVGPLGSGATPCSAVRASAAYGSVPHTSVPPTYTVTFAASAYDVPVPRL